MCNTRPLSKATSPSLIVCINVAYSKLLQELSYRKQIARQLHTQYVEGICRSNYHNLEKLGQGTLKVTADRWIDHTRLTISRVI